MFSKRLLVMVVALVLAATGLIFASCGSDETGTATGEPFKIAYNEDFTGVMSVDAALADHGIQTALKQLNSEVLGRPIEYLRRTMEAIRSWPSTKPGSS